jgi:hypothetical protein
MTPIYSKTIDGPSAWTPASLGGKEGLVWTLTSKHLDAIDELLRKTNPLKMEEIRRADFDHPALTPFLSQIRNEVMNGKCAAIIRGIDTGLYSEADCERIFWGIGTHIGIAAVQSSRADRMGYVRNERGDPKARGYRSSRELVLHTDSRAIIALMSIQVAESGGESRVASSATIHNVIRKERRDLLEPLYRGHPYLSGEIELTPYSIPIFSNVDSMVSCAFFEGHMRAAAKSLGKPLPVEFDEALVYFRTVAHREDVSIGFMLEPGEILISNNFVVLHARTEFEDSAEKRRLLLRLWLNVPDGRPMVPELLYRSRAFDKNYDPLYVAAE